MREEEKRKKLHEILDLVLDVNGFEARTKANTGDAPTVFLSFFGHTCSVTVDIHRNGWRNYNYPDKKMNAYIENGGSFDSLCESDLQNISDFLEGLKDGKSAEL